MSEYGFSRKETWWEVPVSEVLVYLRVIGWRKSKEFGNDKEAPLDVEFLELLEVIETVKKEKYA